MRNRGLAMLAVLTLAGTALLGCSVSTGNPALDDARRACETARGLGDAVADGAIVAGDDAAALRDVTWYSSLAYDANPVGFGTLQSLLRHFTRAAATGGEIAVTALAAADQECRRVGAL